MGIVLWDNIDYKGKKPLDSRMLFDTIADMKAYSENYLPDITLAFNKEDSKMYVFNRENEVDVTTGKWREFEGGATPEVIPEVSTAAELITYLESLTDTDYHKVNLTAVISFPATSLNVRLESSVYAVQRMNDNNIFAFKNEKIYKFNKANNARTVSEVTETYMKSDVYELEMDTDYTVEDFFDEVSISVRNHSDVIYVDQYGTGTLTTTDGTEIAGEFHMILDAGNDDGIRGGKIYQFNEDGEYVNQFNVMVDVAEGTINVISDNEWVDYVYKDWYFVLGNYYAANGYNAVKNRISLITPVEIGEGVEIKTKTGRQMWVYIAAPDSSMTDNNSWHQAINGWVTSYTTWNDGTYYFAFKKNDDSDFNHVDYTVEDVFDVEDYTPFKEKVVEQSSVWKDKVAVFVGDSITAGSGATSGKLYYNYLQQMLWLKEVHVNAEGGRCVSVTSDYGTQHTPLTTQLNNIPVADLICIFMGTNDYGHGTPMGQFAWDTADTDTSFYSALRKTFSTLKNKYPLAQIVWFTPLHRKSLIVDWQTQSVTDDTPNAQGLTLRDYVNTIKEVAAEYSVSVVDLYSQCKLNPRLAPYVNQYMSDGLHPNSAGHKEIAKVAAAYLRSMTFNTQSVKVKKTLKEMDDTNITNPTDWDILSYDATSEKWKNKEVEADSSNVSYRWMTVEQALDEEFKPVENLVTDDTKIIDWFWLKENGTCRISTSIAEFQSFYIPVEEWKTYYTSAKMNSLWIGFLDEDEQAVDALTLSGTSITIPTGQDIKYLSYPQRQAYKPITLITEKPAEFVGELDIYRMTSAWEEKMQYPSARSNGNYYQTDTAFTEGTTYWYADYTYNLKDSVIGIWMGSHILCVNTQDNTAISLSLNSSRIYLFDIVNNTYVYWDSPVTIPEEWHTDVAQHKTPSWLHGAVRVDDANNYILRAEWLSDFVIPKSAIKTRVESQSKVFENYTTASGMIWNYGAGAYKNMGVFTARHRWPIVEKKSEVEIDNPWNNKTWYAYGTSMTDTSMNGYTVELQSLLWANLTNYGKGWSGIIPSLHGGTSWDNTYTRVKRTSDGKTDADLITLEIIPNDMSWTLGTPTDNYADGTTETFCGCLNELLQYLQVNTNAQIVVLIATRSRYNYQDPTEKYPPESQKATDWLAWTDAAKECCRRNCVPFIDGQSNCGLGYARVKDGTKYVRDQIHLTPLGAKNLGQYFYSQIKNIPLFYSE